MASSEHLTLSIVIPVFNEADGIAHFHTSLVTVLKELPELRHEIIYTDDGSSDETLVILHELADSDKTVRVVSLSRNFGKEYALTAGIGQANGDAIITIDSDGQHPVTSIIEFVHAWQAGAQVVIGVRKSSAKGSWLKTVRSKLFYKAFNRITGERLIPGSTDFRLINREVQQAFLALSETDRITRGLIDWLGFDRTIIYYNELHRGFGTANYNSKQLIKLGINSFVSLRAVPLYIFGYTGVAITTLSGLLGLTVLIEQVFLGDPLGWNFTGSAMLGILILFLVGILLTSQGIVSLYISNIHNQTKRRPLFIINRKKSVNIDK